MQLLQSGMKERGDTMAKVVITYTQTVAQPKKCIVLHMLYLCICVQKKTQMSAVFSFFFTHPLQTQ